MWLTGHPRRWPVRAVPVPEQVAQRTPVGTRGRLNVNAVTPAKEAYQAARAVRIPTQPPGLLSRVVVVRSRTRSGRRVAASGAKTARTAPRTRVAAAVM